MLINWQHFSCVFKPLQPHKAETQESHGEGFVSQQKSWVIWSSDSSPRSSKSLGRSCIADLKRIVLLQLWTSCKSVLAQLSFVCTVPFELCPLAPGFQCSLESLTSRPPSEAPPNSEMPGKSLSHLTAAPISAWVRIFWSYCKAAFYPELTINICLCLRLKAFKPGVAIFSRSLLPLHISENYDLQRSLRMPASHEVRFTNRACGETLLPVEILLLDGFPLGTILGVLSFLLFLSSVPLPAIFFCFTGSKSSGWAFCSPWFLLASLCHQWMLLPVTLSCCLISHWVQAWKQVVPLRWSRHAPCQGPEHTVWHECPTAPALLRLSHLQKVQ